MPASSNHLPSSPSTQVTASNSHEVVPIHASGLVVQLPVLISVKNLDSSRACLEQHSTGNTKVDGNEVHAARLT